MGVTRVQGPGSKDTSEERRCSQGESTLMGAVCKSTANHCPKQSVELLDEKVYLKHYKPFIVIPILDTIRLSVTESSFSCWGHLEDST